MSDTRRPADHFASHRHGATALTVLIDGGEIRRIYGHRNPDKLAAFLGEGE